MATPFFSIVIPTRNRPRTLKFAIDTCLAQDFDDFEILVCNNSDGPETAELLKTISSPKLRVIQPPKTLSMPDNWELAVSEAKGEFIHVLGDDDALMPFALRELHRLLAGTKERAIKWSSAFYAWPDVAITADAYYLRLPMIATKEHISFREKAAKVITFSNCYTTLPSVYTSMVHRSVLAELRQRTGRVFRTPDPDVYTGFAVGAVTETYLSIGMPMSIAGVSGKSNGIATHLLKKKNDVAEDYKALNTQAKIQRHRTVPDLSLFPSISVADSFQEAKEVLFPNDTSLQIDRKLLANLYVEALWAADEREWKDRLQMIHKSLSDVPEVQSWFGQTHMSAPFRVSPAARLRSVPFGFDGTALNVDGKTLGIDDIAKAVSFCSNVLGVGNNPVVYHEPSQADAHQVRELEAQVTIFRQAAEERLELVQRLHHEAGKLQKQLQQRGRPLIDLSSHKEQTFQMQETILNHTTHIDELEAQVTMYRTAAEERLALIERLHDEAAKLQQELKQVVLQRVA